MHDVTHDADTPSADNRMLKRIGIVAVIVALLVVAWGIWSRHHSEHQLASWTADQDVQTVAVVRPQGSASGGSLVLPGNLQAFNSAPLYARTNGYVSKWFVDIGSRVKAGEVLAVIDTPDVDQQLAAARADLQTAKANEALAKTTSERWTTLLQKDAVSKQEADEKQGDYAAKRAVTNAAAANVSRLEATEGFSRITAPFAGVVTSRSTQIGQLVSSGIGSATPLFTVSDVSRMRIYVRVPQSYSAEVKPGMHATLTLPEYPGRTFDAVLTRTADAVDQQSGSVLVELQAANPDGALKPGAYAQVTFPVGAEAGSVTIPASAVLFRSDGTLVATVGPDDKVTLHPVKIGRDMGARLEISNGLKASDRVIDSPPDAIEDGDKVVVSHDGGKAGAADAQH